MMETSQENQENEYDDLYIAKFLRNTSLLDDTNDNNDQDSDQFR